MSSPATTTTAPPLTVALIGNPNTGKSTLFNALAGMNARVGNFPGVTVEKKLGRIHLEGRPVTLIDAREPKRLSITVEVPVADMAKVGKNDIVYDLGCGNGVVICIAAKKYGCKGVGIDINPVRIKEAHEMVKKYKVEKLVEIRQGNALKVKDLNRATVVALYMLPEFMELLEPADFRIAADQSLQ